MSRKGDIKIKAQKATEEAVSFDPRLSQDKKTFVLVVESTCPMTWFEAIQACLIYAKDEHNSLTAGVESDTEH